METKRPALPRGRPRTITRERIANAGIALGLPKITIVGIAAKLGISHMALYSTCRVVQGPGAAMGVAARSARAEPRWQASMPAQGLLARRPIQDATPFCLAAPASL
ncbi:hypothetical protein ASG72_06130 [Bosea sp. Leaf344]|uniref:hypothetical protein n=1 Tax=Bosea sp. Leaf344 TaxID=1736346 RepID=UPI0007162180|nr:hypothetical protein [Bosea sp. Leaf344]KQU52510.1 hypothetical protein ASG72_06130 [Bosea sp. Leaf344]